VTRGVPKLGPARQYKADRAPISVLDLDGKMPVDNLADNLINSDISE
jgi:hypothetical protein